MTLTARLAIVVASLVVTAAAAVAQSAGPNSPGSVINDASVGLLPWGVPGNAAISDDMRALATPGGSPTNYLRASSFGFAIPGSAVIDGIEVNVERQSAAGTIFDSAVRIIKGGVIGATDRSAVGFWVPPMIDTVVTYGSNSDLWGEIWTAADINSPAFGFVISVDDNVDTAAVDAISITVYYSLCGDNTIGLSEECDDGNTMNGDCCSSTCQFEADGSPCAQDGNDCNGDETCDGAGTCVSIVGPLGSCRTAMKGVFVYKNKMDDAKDKLTWKWIKGLATTFPDFGNPTTTTSYTLCVYAGTGAAIAQATVPPVAGWAVLGADKGYKFKDTSGPNDGITQVKLKSGAANKAKALVKGKGSNLPDPAGPPFTLPVTVQLVNSDNNICYTTAFGVAKKNQPGLFKAKAP